MNATTFRTLPLLVAVPVLGDDTHPALSDQQVDEVRRIAKDALADASQRNTLSGPSAGIGADGKAYLKSGDDAYTLQLGGRVQFRYVYNDVEGAPATPAGSDQDLSEGFDLRRVNLDFQGQAGQPGLTYRVQLGTNFSGLTGSQIGVELAYAEYALNKYWSLLAGKFWQPYTRESLISSGRQVAVERGLADGYFGLGRSEGVQATYVGDHGFSLRSALNDGGRTEATTIGADNIRFISTAHRAEWQLAGEAKDAQDNLALANDKRTVVLGAGAYYENYAHDATAASVDDAWGATLDATGKFARNSLTVAAFYREENGVNDLAAEGYQQRGATLGFDRSLTAKVDVFAKYDYIDSDTASTTPANKRNDPLQALTVGVNYNPSKNLKLTGDLVWFVDGRAGSALAPGGSAGGTGQGIVNTGSNDNDVFTVRGQVQLSF